MKVYSVLAGELWSYDDGTLLLFDGTDCERADPRDYDLEDMVPDREEVEDDHCLRGGRNEVLFYTVGGGV